MPKENVDARAPAGWERFIFGRRPERTLFRIFGLAVSCFLLFKFVLLPIRVSGLSMFPSYKPGQIDYVNRLSYRWRPLKRGDVVSIMTTGMRVTILKRVVGLPGERVRMRRGQVFINGQSLDEPYVKSKGGWNMREILLQKDVYWVIGDNRAVSQFAPVPRRFVIGKVLF